MKCSYLHYFEEMSAAVNEEPHEFEYEPVQIDAMAEVKEKLEALDETGMAELLEEA